MKEIIVHPLPTLTTTMQEVEIPSPGPDEVVIRVAVAGSNVKDWAHITARRVSVNSGDDVAGWVHALGERVAATAEFRTGDRVAGFHPMLAPGGAYAEFALVPYHTVFKIPQGTSFEEAATIPLVAMTAAISLFAWQSLPTPWAPRESSVPLPLVIYGASSALGSFAVKLAKAANIHPIIAIGGGSHAYVSSLLDPSRGDAFIDYRSGTDAMIVATRAALGALPARHALDAISANGTWIPLSQMLAPGATLSVVSGANRYDEPEIQLGVDIAYTYVGAVHSGAYLAGMPKQPPRPDAIAAAPELAYVFFRYLARMLSTGAFEGHPYEVIPGGLNGVGDGLRRLKNGEARGKKFVYRVADTLGEAL